MFYLVTRLTGKAAIPQVLEELGQHNGGDLSQHL